MRHHAIIRLLLGIFALHQSAEFPVCAEEKLAAVSENSKEPSHSNSAGYIFLDETSPTPTDAQIPTIYYEDGELIALPPLEEELLSHGGAHLYETSDVLHQFAPQCEGAHEQFLRLDECWEEPQPLCSRPNEYLGTGLIQWNPDWNWFGCDPNMWEPRFVLHGAYDVFGAVYEANNQRQDGIGHQLFVDLDLRLTGTERFHVQFRPLGEENSGGSFWQLNDPVHYIDNSTGVPQRWWFEGELQSLFGPWKNDQRHQLDVNFTVGRFPFRLHNGLLMNDEIVGVVLGKNTITSLGFSNLNVQLFHAFDEVDSYPASGDLSGVNITADYRGAFFEATYAYIDRNRPQQFSTNYLALSGTKFIGPLTLAARTMYRIESDDAGGNGNLQVIETAFTRSTSNAIQCLTGVELAVAYLNLFYASENWITIAGGNLSRLRNAFTVDPLLNLAAGTNTLERYGASAGVQLFRHHQDEAIIPEFAYEEISADPVFGIGLRYRRKINARTFLELRGIKNWSDNAVYRREGLFLSSTTIF